MSADYPAVLLVPGWSDRERVLRPLQHHLLAAGWPDTHVLPLGFRHRFGSNLEHAHEIAAAAEALAAAAAVPRITVVAHSMGGLALRWYLTRMNGDTRVERAFFLATPHHGTWLAWLAFGAGAREMRPGSRFLQDLNARTLPPQVHAHCIRTPLDLRIFPPASALLDGALATVVRAPTHPGLLRSRKVFRIITQTLLREAAP